MSWQLRPVLSYAVAFCFVSSTMFALTFVCLPRTVTAQAIPAASSQRQLAPDAVEMPPLTAAQQEARALATVLTGKKSSDTTPLSKTPLVFFREQSLRPGKRLVVVLGTWQSGQVRLVSGQQNLASPIDVQLPILTKHGLTPLTAEEDIALAIEVLAE